MRSLLSLSVPMWCGVAAASLAGGCGGFGVGGCVDADGDGVCDDDRSCEVDGDGDGVCNADDICPAGDDAKDADADGVPDACDACPEVEGGDADGDGACDLDDPCPDDADDTCDENIFFALQVDGFPEESSWSLLGPDNTTVDQGSFTSAGGGYTRRIALSASGLSCLTVRDTEGNGGVRGRVFSRRRGLVFAEWDFYDWTTKSESFCFDLGADGEPREDLPVEDAFLAEARMCSVTVRFTTGLYAEEHAWVLRLKDGDRLAGWGGKWTGGEAQYTAADADTVDQLTVPMPPGQYEVDMVDRYGDGWNGDEFEDNARITVSVNGSEVADEQLTASFCDGESLPCTFTFPITVSGCN